MGVLVTGATGGLGEVLTRRLLAEGREVRVLTRRPFRAEAMFGSAVAVQEWHPFSEPVPPAALDGATAIIHLMGAPFAGGPARDRASLAERSRVTSTRALVEAIAGRGIRLVATSVVAPPPASAGEMADGDAGLPATLDNPLAPWEAEALAAEAGGNSAAIVRLGLLAMRGPVVGAMLALARVRMELDLDDALIPAIDPEDAAAMLSGLVDMPGMTGAFLGVAPEPVKGEAIAAALAPVAMQPLPFPLPLPLTRKILARRIGLLGPLLTMTTPLVPRQLLAAGARFQTPDPTEMFCKAIAEQATATRPSLRSLPLFELAAASVSGPRTLPEGRTRPPPPPPSDAPKTDGPAPAGPAAASPVPPAPSEARPEPPAVAPRAAGDRG